MRWIHSTRRDRQFRSGLSSWTSAGSPRTKSWRWPARPYTGSPGRLCPLRQFCPEREIGSWATAFGDLDDPDGAGSLAAWLSVDEPETT